jgi:uncharacterized membrane protein
MVTSRADESETGFSGVRDAGKETAKETARLETFVDGVFAIAITLLVLDIRIPEPGEDLVAALARQWPSFVAYVISFLSIGVMWVSHHRLFQMISRLTTTFLYLNVLFLLPVAFIPYPTALVAQHFQEPDARTAAVLLYGLVSILIAVMFNVLWQYAARHRLLSLPRDRALGAVRGYALGPLAYAIATLVVFISPLLSMAGFAGLAVFWMLSGREGSTSA